ncbi:hypothetical protein OIDMADRAFT_186302 [Oidiodendron maius Zn]|uniref:Acyl-CoA dehydrogenase/oxidase C-terminal domain-containing protein n=1 Tax=Oidiodendron maius (strain Zn) TaxID=913774 RepID=A0A0C3HZB6_OIDMZ|nr:hypothetical protein OIDMADRAFT_186302 [Oidiodendron maius Zn]
MDTSLDPALQQYLNDIDDFIAREITPLQLANDNNRFFDHRREDARTNWNSTPHSGLPSKDWEKLLEDCRQRADKAGFYRFSLPTKYGGKNGSNLWMAVIREHLAARGLGLFNDLQNEHSIVGNFPDIIMFDNWGNQAQKDEFIWGRLNGTRATTFGLTEPGHGSDATHMSTRAVRETRDGVAGWRIDGAKAWQTGMHRATHCTIFARTSGKNGDAKGITAFIVPATTDGIKVESYEWTFNMPTDHATVSITNVFIPDSAVFGPIGGGLSLAQAFVHENRIRQAASSLGAAKYCINESVKYSRQRKPFGTDLAKNQAIQFPLVELATQVEMLQLLIRKTANEMDNMSREGIAFALSDKVSMCNYWANRLCTQAADQAMQVHGAIGYSRHKPFEHIYRHHRRYRITEGSEEIQMRKVAAYLFGYIGPRKAELSRL